MKNIQDNFPEMRNCELGENSEIAPNVMLGYCYKGWSQPARIGKMARIHSGSVIYADTVIGERFSCGHNVTIRAECTIGNRVAILHGCTLEGKIKIGKGVKIMTNVYIPSRTVIGDLVFIGPGVTILNDKLPMRKLNGHISGVTIGNNVMVGGGVTLAPGITIGDNVFIAAGALIVKDIPANTFAIGTPATYKPMPEQLGKGNVPEQLFVGADLWHVVPDDGTWKEEDFPGKDEWLSRNKNA